MSLKTLELAYDDVAREARHDQEPGDDADGFADIVSLPAGEIKAALEEVERLRKAVTGAKTALAIGMDDVAVARLRAVRGL